MSITQDYLKEWLSYNPETGIFTWIKIQPQRPDFFGKRAGSVKHKGYRELRIEGRKIYEHRAAFLYMTGEVPDYIDHIDADTSNNAWANLRAIDNSANTFRGYILRGENGIKQGARGKFSVVIHRKGERHYVGCFDTKEEAREARKKKAKELYGEFV